MPLSAPQPDFWEAALAYPVPSTHIYAAEYLEIRGALDTGAFERALRQVIREAQTLHTTHIVLHGDTPVRVLDAAIADDWTLEYVDLAGTADAHAGMRAHCTGAIELARGPFFRHTLYRIAPDHYYWYQGYAHILVDGYSGSLIAVRAPRACRARVPDAAPRRSDRAGRRRTDAARTRDAGMDGRWQDSLRDRQDIRDRGADSEVPSAERRREARRDEQDTCGHQGRDARAAALTARACTPQPERSPGRSRRPGLGPA
ncbi:condensation domain-containing protein [Burkholderia pyrrocinia]|uniref:condensation domain-containing protein n=1 Tax=Burkholderia pyrrocinia TaxID=60550 RepID=UPI003D9A838E